MAGNDELRAKAREAAFLARIQCAGTEAIADAVLSAILPELDARVRAAREAERDAVVAWLGKVIRRLRDEGHPSFASRALYEAIARGEHRETEGE